jgi:predicted ATPase
MDGKAEIECRLNGEDYILQFIKKEHKVHVCTNKEMVPSIINIDGKKYRNIGTLFSGSTDQNVSYSKNLIENTLLVSSNLIKMGFEYLKNNWASIINLGIAKKVVEDVSNLSYEKYIDITIEPFLGGRSAIYAYLEDGRRIRLGDLGEGIQNYIIAKMLYEIEKPKVLLWDDIESHFNPRMTLSIANWFSDLIEKGNQIVLTTHSLEAARTIASLNEEKARIYLTALDKNIFKTKSLALEEVEDLLKAGIDIRVAEPMLL